MWDTPDGSSTDPCDDLFRGETEGDAPETQVLTTALHEIERQQGLKLYIDWHSYSQVLMTPYGYNCSYVAEDNDEMQLVARGAAEAMTSVYGTHYTSGTICQVMYEASGNSIDFVTDIVGGDYAFGVELRDLGDYGFVLPPEQILPTCREAFEGVKYLLRNLK
jgi:murein tripeptide amidase MpaA